MRYPNVNLDRANAICIVPYDEFRIYQYDKFPHAADIDSCTTVLHYLDGLDNAYDQARKETDETKKISYSDLPIRPIAHPYAIYRSTPRIDQRRRTITGPVIPYETNTKRPVENETFRYSIRPKRALLYSAINYMNGWDY